jgi:hypothetical protein
MGLFGKKSCPLEKKHLLIYGIHSPRKWVEQDCLECQYVLDSQCNYKQVAAQLEKLILRGRPAVVKKATLSEPAAVRQKAESEALKKAAFAAGEQREYWVVSQEYDRLWETASPDQKRDVLDRLDQLRIHLEKGDSPALAAEKANEWFRQREEFKRGEAANNSAG